MKKQNQNKFETLFLNFLSQIDKIHYKKSGACADMLYQLHDHKLCATTKNQKILNMYLQNNAIFINYGDYKFAIIAEFEALRKDPFHIGAYIDKNDNIVFSCVNVDFDPSNKFKTQFVKYIETFKQMLINNICDQI